MKNTITKTVKQDGFSPKKSLLTVAVATAVSTMALPAYSLTFEPTSEITVDLDTTLSYTAGWRVSDQNEDLLANTRADDGNRNFEKGSMINNKVSILSEMDIRYQNYGAFLRGAAFYDGAYFGKNDHDNQASINHDTTEFAYNSFTDKTQEVHGKDVRLLDAFVYGNFEIGERNLNLRVGRQVVQWGESLLYPGVSGGMSPADGTKAVVPGTEVKEIFLPVGQVFTQLDLTENLNVAGYYQWEWKKTEASEYGSFFSLSDLVDEAGTLVLPYGSAGPSYNIKRGQDKDAKDSGQWGLALNYYAENVGYGTEFGLYYINYHEKAPSKILLDFAPDATGAGNYHIEYLENIKLLGASFGTLLGDTNVGGEISYRKGATVGANSTTDTGMRANVVQAQLSAIHSFGVSSLADDVLMVAEIGYDKITNKKKEELAEGKRLSGAGVKANFTLKYNNVMPATNVEVPITLAHSIRNHGAGGAFSGGDSASIGMKAIYQDQWQAEVKYSAYFGKAEDNAFTDRDNVSINVKYTF
ncbi:DUF1302 domain-containing protein [Endozoicomonas sp. OPT23]|uniref:DUF1302 domain-containing protein n=1 Tax=Endozoicomonas sp. OPT23 TaxID=2072845 RepID=UPI00129B6A0A|nr:DUF1302 domain-containing protein [Endozoicomonas sp. OPT23]MRI33839.1 DUF1302 domain-containing protein [Endozoicomonas sp. OPT23]